MNTLPVALTAGLEAALNKLISMDPAAQGKIKELSGKVIAIELKDLNLQFHLLPTGETLCVQGKFEGEADATLRGSSLSMLRMGLRDNASDSLFSGDVAIDGDVELGEKFRSILDSIDIDWEEQLSKITGDVAAHQVGRVVRGVMEWGGRTAETLRQDVTEYLHEESRIVPAHDEVESFSKAVDQIRMDVDRLEARLQRLKARLVPEAIRPTKNSHS